MNERAAGIDDIRHVAAALLLSRREQWLPQASDHFGGIVLIEQKRADRNTVASAPRRG